MSKGKFQIKAVYSTVLLTAASVMLLLSSPGYASNIDNRIESSAKESYIFKRYLNEDVIQVTSKDGVVTLTGSVADEFHKQLAMETVAGLPGVLVVDNQLLLKNANTASGSDSLVSERVKLAMLHHRNLSSLKPDIQVKNGVVTIRGEAAIKSQIDLATE